MKKYAVGRSTLGIWSNATKIPTYKATPINPLITLFHHTVYAQETLSIVLVAAEAPNATPMSPKIAAVSLNVSSMPNLISKFSENVHSSFEFMIHV